MCKKIANFVYTGFTHPIRIMFPILLTFLLMIIISRFVPHLVAQVALLIFFILIVGSFFIYHIESKKEEKKRKEWTVDEYIQKHYSYVFLVNEYSQEEHYTVQSSKEEWIKNFDQCIYALIGERFNSKLNDFDIAACFIYAFLLCHCSDEELAFVFECAKRIIKNPKSYAVTYLLSGEFQLEERKSFEGTLCVPDKQISKEAILAILRAYFLPVNSTGILQLSDFLHVLFLRSRKNSK